MKLLIAAGGTAGHVIPALAVVEELRRRCDTFDGLLVGRHGGSERELAEKAGLGFEGLWIEGWVHRSFLGRVRTLSKLPIAFIQARSALKRFRPDIVLGMGSYVSLPVVFAASRLGTKTLIHEQNRVPGLANRICTSRADRIAATFPPDPTVFPLDKTTLTGNPVRSELLQAPITADTSNDTFKVLIFGGSQGARRLNQSFREALDEIDPAEFQFEIIAGRSHADRLRQDLEATGYCITVHDFLQDMARVYRWADLVICRGGASTLAEITALGKAAVLVPIDNPDQQANAQFLADCGGAVVIPDCDLTGTRLAQILEELRGDPARRSEMARIAAAEGRPDAAAKVADLLVEMLEKS